MEKTTQFPIFHQQSPIRAGKVGKINGQSFEIIGTCRIWFEESVFDLHTLSFSNGDNLWLAEGYGKFILYTKDQKNKPPSIESISSASFSKAVQLYGIKGFWIQKKNESYKWEMVGENIFPYPDCGHLLFIDLASMKGEEYSLIYFGRKEAWILKSLSLNLSDLGMQADPASEKQEHWEFVCVSCHQTIKLKSFPFSQSCACPYCGKAYSLNAGGQFVPVKATTSIKEMAIPIGTKGTFNGFNYEIVGFMEKQDDSRYQSRWREYTLFNEIAGYAFLSEYDGHWIFLREPSAHPVMNNENTRELKFENEPFLLYNKYSATVIHAVGEFPNNQFDNSGAKVREFISPPEIWIEERDNKEGITWFHGKHISPWTIRKAFGLLALPSRVGVGAVQPVGYINATKLILVSTFAVALLSLIFLLTSNLHQERTIYSGTYFFKENQGSVKLVTEKFELDKYRANMRIHVEADLYNSWLEVGANLVNTKNGKERYLVKGVEFYDGYSEGEYWEEGSRTGNAYFTRIPRGTYFLELTATKDTTNKTPSFVNLDIIYDRPDYRNLFWSILLLLLWPVSIFIWSNQREKKRWLNSPFSPIE